MCTEDKGNVRFESVSDEIKTFAGASVQLCMAPSQGRGVILEKLPAERYRYVGNPFFTRRLYALGQLTGNPRRSPTLT